VHKSSLYFPRLSNDDLFTLALHCRLLNAIRSIKWVSGFRQYDKYRRKLVGAGGNGILWKFETMREQKDETGTFLDHLKRCSQRLHDTKRHKDLETSSRAALSKKILDEDNKMLRNVLSFQQKSYKGSNESLIRSSDLKVC